MVRSTYARGDGTTSVELFTTSYAAGFSLFLRLRVQFGVILDIVTTAERESHDRQASNRCQISHLPENFASNVEMVQVLQEKNFFRSKALF